MFKFRKKQEQESNLDKWIKALRSGKYTQGYGRLYGPVNNSYCCLGVLCDLYRKENGGEFNSEGTTLITENGLPVSTSGEFLPDPVVDWLGVSINQYALVVRNDERRFSFPEIADYLDGYRYC